MTLAYANRMNLSSMRPRGDLASSGYCLANPGEEYLIYVPLEVPWLESRRFFHPLKHELTIEPDRVERQYWHDLWRYRELFYFLAWRDILVRYKQTVVGVAWALIRPFLTMIGLDRGIRKIG